MSCVKPLRLVGAALILLVCVASAFAQLLSPAVRGKAMDAIRDKYRSLAAQPLAERRKQTVAFAKTLKEILRAEVTEDGNIACVFKDNVPYMILGNIAIPKEEPKKLMMHRPAGPESFAPRAALKIAQPIDFSEFAAAPPMPQIVANDLPASLDVRIANSLGKVFGDSCPEVRKLLTDKGYKVAPGTDASIRTLMGLKDLGVFYMQCHGGNGLGWNPEQRKFVEEYYLMSSDEWSPAKETGMEAIRVPGMGGLMAGGFLSIGDAIFDLDANKKEIVKRYFWFNRRFIRTFWRFSNNSFVLIYGCTTFRINDVMAEQVVNNSVYCGVSDLGHNDCHKWIKLFFDRMTGTNDPAIPPAEDVVAQRPFDWQKLFADFKDRKRLWPTVYTYENIVRRPSPSFHPNRQNFGLLTPSIKFISPVPYQRKLELIGMFGKDPGEANRKVTIADVAQVVDKWAPDKITVLLADNPLGASGEVKVFHQGRPSNSRWLSKWIGHIGITIAGEQSLAMNADFNVNLIGDPWPYRENPGVKPVEQMVWNTFTTTGSTCTWNASGEEKDSNNKVIRSWKGEGQPKCWLDENMGTQNTFGVGGVADTYQKKMNLYMAIVGNFTLTEHGTAEPKTPIKLGDWMQGQTLFQASYDRDYNIIGDKRTIEDEPSKLSYGGKSAVLVWDSMQCRYGMPRTAAR